VPSATTTTSEQIVEMFYNQATIGDEGKAGNNGDDEDDDWI
jgi:hypothetical protein